MGEKEKSRGGSGDNRQSTVSGPVDVKGKTLRHDDGTVRNITVRRGARLSDVIAEVKKYRNIGDLSQYTIRLNDRTIATDKGGLAEDPVITENFALTLTTQVKGGQNSAA